MSQNSFGIEGLDGTPRLSGKIPVAGAKNAALIALAAPFLFEDPMVIENIPEIEDITRMTELLTGLGAEVEKSGQRLTITPPRNSNGTLGEAAKRMRASIVLSGPVLARYGRVELVHPGGCVIGPRPIDQFESAFTKMGAHVSSDDEHYVIEAPNGLSGTDIFFTLVSVTATQTTLMAAVRAKGVTHLSNAAMEPEVVELANFLNTCGARIAGAGTPFITIEGVPELRTNGTPYRTIPDRIETGSFLILGALAAEELTVTDCIPEHVGILIELLREAGVDMKVEKNSITVRGGKKYSAVDVRTHEYPGFATDLQAPMTVFLTQAEGEARVFETIFEGRLAYAEDLRLMGADITPWNRREIMIKGPRKLSGRELAAPDIRAGLAFIIAALIAEGPSIIHNAYFIDRGYEHIDGRLRALGATITRS